MTNGDSQRIKEIRDNTAKMADAFTRIADALERLADRKTENSSEIPNNCEHITEDGVTCARYPACDDCHSNPLNKVKGSERLVKGTEQTEPQNHSGEVTEMVKDEPQTDFLVKTLCKSRENHEKEGEQTDCQWK